MEAISSGFALARRPATITGVGQRLWGRRGSGKAWEWRGGGFRCALLTGGCHGEAGGSITRSEVSLSDLLGEHTWLSVVGPELEAGVSVGKLQPQTKSWPCPGWLPQPWWLRFLGRLLQMWGWPESCCYLWSGCGLFVHCLLISKVFNLFPNGLWLCILSENPSSALQTWRYYPILPSKNVVTLIFFSGSLIHLGLTFVISLL